MSSHHSLPHARRPLRSSLPVLFISLLILPVLIILAPPVPSVLAQRAPMYVRAGATGSNNGTSWTDAYTSLQTALTAAHHGDHIWVAAGTYTPGTNRTDTFQLKSGVAIYGGFTGTESNRNERNPNPATNGTVLSGAIGAPGKSDNSFNVVTGDGVRSTAILDGFTITGGNASGGGGGMTNVGGSPTLGNIIFAANQAQWVGGGLFNGSGSNTTLINVIFRNNRTTAPTVGLGGGMYNGGGMPSNARLRNVLFTGNASQQGGALYTLNSTLRLTNTTMVNNVSGNGGGIYILSGTPTIQNSVIWGNTAPAHAQIFGTPTYNHSLVQGLDLTGTGTNNLDGADPGLTTNTLFVDFAGGNFYPRAGSALIDVGNNSALPGRGAGLSDLLGQARVWNTTVDIGAFEHHATNPTAVELLSFVVVTEPTTNTLTWITLSEMNVSGYTIQQHTAAGWVQVSPFLPAEGSGATYRWQERDPPPNTAYRLAVIDTDQTRTYHLPDTVVASPNTYFLPLVVR